MQYRWIELLGWVAWSVAVIGAWRASQGEGTGRHGWWRTALIGAFLAFRFPLWTSVQEHSPDESQSLAGALTLWGNPLFWKSVDGATAGPLHYYLLMPAAWFSSEGGMYFVSRLIGYILLLSTLFMTGRLVRGISPRAEPWVVVPAVSAYAFSRSTDLQHASTELLAGWLIALALVLYFEPQRGRGWLWLAGAALGCVPWAKLQAAPMAGVLGLAAVAAEWAGGRSRNAAGMIVAGVMPTLAVATVLTLGNLWPDMITPYFLANSAYAGASRFTLGSALHGFFTALGEDGQAAWWLGASGLMVVGSLAMTRPASSSHRVLFEVAWAWLGLAVACVAIARRPFLHYWHLLSAPWLLVVGLSLARLEASRWTRVRAVPARWRVTLLGVLVLPLMVHRLAGRDHFEWVRTVFARYAGENRELAEVIRPYVRSDDAMAIWGNRSGLYVAAGLSQATRQAHTETQLRPNGQQPYFLRVYMDDFRHRRPAVFVDATGDGNLGFDTRNQPHEAFAPLAELVRTDYTLFVQRHGTRIYLRNDRAKPPAATN